MHNLWKWQEEDYASGIETIFDDLEQMLHHLKKKSYEANTEVFVRENGFYFEEMKRICRPQKTRMRR